MHVPAYWPTLCGVHVDEYSAVVDEGKKVIDISDILIIFDMPCGVLVVMLMSDMLLADAEVAVGMDMPVMSVMDMLLLLRWVAKVSMLF